jgi:hypothetical protein
MAKAKRLRFQKRPDRDLVFIPDVGRVSPGQILEGPEYKRFCPDLLVQIEDEPVEAPSSPVEAPSVVETPEVSVEPEEAPEPPPAPVGPSVVEDLSESVEAGDPEVSAEPEEAEEPAESGDSKTTQQSSAKMKRRAAARRKRRTS